MNPKSKIREVAKALYVNYLKRSGECLNAARTSFNHQEWNAATINAIHSCIAACDAMCVYYLGIRSAGEGHGDAVSLFKTIKADKEISANANRIAQVLGIKNAAEYEDRLMHRSEAERTVKACERFYAYVNKKLPH